MYCFVPAHDHDTDQPHAVVAVQHIPTNWVLLLLLLLLLQSTAYRHKVELTLEALLANLKAMQQLLERNGLKNHASFYQ
jgi:hypothetical protein